ncbi:MAG: helix-hairpin-helix domain-containing protein [Halalkalicoccus sp.]
MALLDKLKSLLGFDDGSDGDRQGTDTVGVTVERDRETADQDTDEEGPPGTPAPGSDAAEPVEATEPTDSEASADEGGPEIDPDVETPATDEGESQGEPPEEPVGEPAIDGEELEHTESPDLEADTDAGTDGPVSKTDHAAEGDESGGATPDPGVESTSEADAASGEGALDGDVDEDDGSMSVRDIKGIGPSYATKLSEAGVDSPADLAEADAGELSEATGLSEKRIQGWIDRARSG